MFLRYVLENGEQQDIELGKQALTIGRGDDADLSVPDKLSSRIHCGISFWDDAYFLRDFKSRNGTFVNDHRVDVIRLRVGDQIRIGTTIITVEDHPPKGTETVLKEVKDEMASGKGYNTILKEIVQEEEEDRKKK
ncbi:FHA domain-containing protein [Verrucomicrobiota bacterium]